MIPDDSSRFRNLICGMGRMFGAELDAVLLDAYWLGLRDWEYGELEAVAAHLMRTAKFMPRPADFNQVREKAEAQAADEAWSMLLQNLRRGEYRDGTTLGGKVDLIVRAMGGYESLGKRNSDALHQFGAREFRELWHEIGEREQARAVLPHLAPPEARSALGRASGPRPVGALLDHLVKPR